MSLLVNIVKLFFRFLLLAVFVGVLITVVAASLFFILRQLGFHIVDGFDSHSWSVVLLCVTVVFLFFLLTFVLGRLLKLQQKYFPGRYQRVVRDVSGCPLTIYERRTRIGSHRFVQPYCHRGTEHDSIGAVIIDDKNGEHRHIPFPVELEPTANIENESRSLQTALLESDQYLVIFNSCTNHNTHYIASCDLNTEAWKIYYPKHLVNGEIANVFDRSAKSKHRNPFNDEDLTCDEWIMNGKHCRDGNVQLVPDELSAKYEHDMQGIMADEVIIRQIPAGMYVETRYEKRCESNDGECEETERFCYSFNPPLHPKYR